MKKLSFLLLTIFFIGLLVCPTCTVNAQGVGIGTTTPLSTLDVAGSEAQAITTINSATTLDATMSTIIVTPSSAYTITLPTLASSVRRVYTIVYNGIPGTTAITISGNGANIISNGFSTANFLLFGGTLTLQNNGANWYAVSLVTIPCSDIPATPGPVIGPTSVCLNTTGNIYSVPVVNAITYNWVLPTGATITSGLGTNTITVTMGSTSGNVIVSASNNCGTSPASPPLSVTVTNGALIALDASNQQTAISGATTTTLTINTTNANEIIIIGVNGATGTSFTGSVAVSGAGPLSLVTSANTNPNVGIFLYACAANASGSHTITVTWAGFSAQYSMVYAASFSGFCGTPTVAANVQGVSSGGTTTVSASITPAAVNSYLFGDYYNYTGSSTLGSVAWTNNNLIRNDHQNGSNGWDGSIAGRQLSATTAVTVTATDNVVAGIANGTSLILAVVHP